MEHLKNMKTKLVDCIEKQINGNLEYASTKELGEAVDMVKDLSEAIYYCTITEAMEGKGQQSYGSHYPTTHYYGEPYGNKYPMGDYYQDPYGGYSLPIMYASNGGNGGGHSGGNGGSRYMSYEPSYTPYPMNEDRSTISKRRYMDSKRYNDKTIQMQELEKYTQELASDLTDMIKDASPEEKQLLQQKISLLASKIK